MVTISSIDGDTFIVDRHLNMTRFRPPLSSNTGCGGGSDSIGNTNFYDQIQAFTCGIFGDNIFSFVYVLTHNDKIIIVHSIETNNSRTSNLLASIDEKYKEGNKNQRFFHFDLFDCLVVSTPDKFKDILHPSH